MTASALSAFTCVHPSLPSTQSSTHITVAYANTPCQQHAPSSCVGPTLFLFQAIMTAIRGKHQLPTPSNIPVGDARVYLMQYGQLALAVVS